MLNPVSRFGGLKVRVVAFALAMAAMVALIVWTGHSTWRRTGELRERLTAVQLKSFQIADKLQESIWELKNIVFRYGVYHSTNDWARFERLSSELDRWIDEQRPILSTEQEKRIVDQINTSYDDFMAAARQIQSKARLESEPAPIQDFAEFERQSQHLQSLGIRLAGAHSESMETFLLDSNTALSHLRFLLLMSLAFLLAAAGGLMAVLYRDLVAPLRVKLVENQMLMERQEKLASLGMLAAGVAHEIRNPLTAIKGWLFVQQKHFHQGTAEYDDAQVIADEINRLDRIVKEVLLFARPSEPHLVTVPVHDSLREVQALLAPELEKNQIQLACENSVPGQVRIDPQQIKQVLINLVRNAAESIGSRGTVTLRARSATQRLADTVKDVVILEVSDTGKGIAPEVEKRLFDPFFTTKETGTGLGLSIAARIVEKHGGALQYQTKVNRGTTFGVVLPRV